MDHNKTYRVWHVEHMQTTAAVDTAAAAAAAAAGFRGICAAASVLPLWLTHQTLCVPACPRLCLAGVAATKLQCTAVKV
jgi:hypothetical protein